MSEWVNLAYVRNNSTSNENIRIIARKQDLLAWAYCNPYVTLYPHQVVVSCPPHCYGVTAQSGEGKKP